MNKNLKRIIALVLAVGTVSAVAPATSGTSWNLLTTKAYAGDGDENEDETLDSLEIESSNGDTIKLYSDDDYKSDDRLEDDDTPSDDDTYYAKTNYDKVQVKISGPKSKYVKVFKGTSKSTKGKSTQDDISLSSGTTKLIVRVYNNNPDEDIEYDDDADKATDYEIEIKHTDSSSDTNSNSADDYDDIYLEKLSVYTGDTKDISLSESKIDYSCDVAYNIKEVIITAEPDNDDEVTIDGNEVSDNYRKKVSLNVGENKFKIKTENNDNDERVYTLTINRAAQVVATTTATAQTNTATAVATTTVKANQWIQVNGRWQYNDSLGRPVTNTWQSSKGKWYYLGPDSYMQSSCWILAGGKYYYLYSDGSMAANTTIGGYKVGSDGAWIR